MYIASLAQHFKIWIQGNSGIKIPALRFECFDMGFNEKSRFIVEIGETRYKLEPSLFARTFIEVENKLYYAELLQFIDISKNNDLIRYKLIFGSILYRLENISNYKVYTQKFLSHIITDILTSNGLESECEIEDCLLPYKVQDEISDYEFLLRLCVEYKLAFYVDYNNPLKINFINKINNIKNCKHHTLQFYPSGGFKTPLDANYVTSISINYTLDTQRWLKIKNSKIQLMLGDKVNIINHPEIRVDEVFYLVHFDCFHEDGKSNQEAILISDSDMYFASHKVKFNLPKFQLGVIIGDKKEVPVDDFGAFDTLPLFADKTNNVGHPMYQVGTYDGKTDTGVFGLRFPLFTDTHVIIGHLEDDIEKPFILGVVPTDKQKNPVTEINKTELVIKHENQSSLLFNDCIKTQNVIMHTEKDVHNICIYKQENVEGININSLGHLDYESNKELNLFAGRNLKIKSKYANFSSRDEISISALEEINWKIKKKFIFNIVCDWKLAANKGKWSVESTEKLIIQGSNVNFEAKKLKFDVTKANLDAKSQLIEGKDSFILQGGNSKIIANYGVLTLNAPCVKLTAAQIIQLVG